MAYGKKPFGSNRNRWGTNNAAERQRKERERRDRERRDRERRDRERRERERRDRERKDRAKREEQRKKTGWSRNYKAPDTLNGRKKYKDDSSTRNKINVFGGGQKVPTNKNKVNITRYGESKIKLKPTNIKKASTNITPTRRTAQPKNVQTAVPVKKTGVMNRVQNIRDTVKTNRVIRKNEKSTPLSRERSAKENAQKQYKKAVKNGDVKNIEKYEKLVNKYSKQEEIQRLQKEINTLSNSKTNFIEQLKQKAEVRKIPLSDSQQDKLKRLKAIAVSPTATDAEKRQAKIEYLQSKKSFQDTNILKQAKTDVEYSDLQKQKALETQNRNVQSFKDTMNATAREKVHTFPLANKIPWANTPLKKAQKIAGQQFTLAKMENKRKEEQLKVDHANRTKSIRIEQKVIKDRVSHIKADYKERTKKLDKEKTTALAKAQTPAERTQIEQTFNHRKQQLVEKRSKALQVEKDKAKNVKEILKNEKQRLKHEQYLAKIQFEQQKLNAKIEMVKINNQRLSQPKFFGTTNTAAIEANKQYIRMYKNQLKLYEAEEKEINDVLAKAMPTVEAKVEEYKAPTTSFENPEKALREIEAENTALRNERVKQHENEQNIWQKKVTTYQKQREEFNSKRAEYETYTEQQKLDYLSKREKQIEQYEYERINKISYYESKNQPIPHYLQTSPYEREISEIGQEKYRLYNERLESFISDSSMSQKELDEAMSNMEKYEKYNSTERIPFQNEAPRDSGNVEPLILESVETN